MKCWLSHCYGIGKKGLETRMADENLKQPKWLQIYLHKLYTNVLTQNKLQEQKFINSK